MSVIADINKTNVMYISQLVCHMLLLHSILSDTARPALQRMGESKMFMSCNTSSVQHTAGGSTATITNTVPESLGLGLRLGLGQAAMQAMTMHSAAQHWSRKRTCSCCHQR